MKLSIKNMVCDRCKLIVQDICSSMNLDIAAIKLGEVKLDKTVSAEQKQALATELAKTGLYLLDDAKQTMIEHIKQACLSYLNQQVKCEDHTLSKFISAQVNKEYSYLSRLFSSVESISIEQYYIALRIEKVKELITYEQLSFAEISHDMGFSSTAHLSRQFKQVTGLTLSEFRKNADITSRLALDKVKNLQQ